MAFIFWVLLILPAAALGVLLEKIFSPIVSHFQWLFRPAVFYTVCKVLIVLNILLLIALLVVGYRQKRAGKLAWPYIDSFRGWKHLWLIAVKLILFWGPVWELGVIVFFFLLIALRVVGPVP